MSSDTRRTKHHRPLARGLDEPSAGASGGAAVVAFPVGTGILFGLGFGGFFDGIVFHQLLQWHHMVSSWYPPDNLVNLRFNTLWDGIFHSFNYVVLVIAVYRFAGARQRLGRCIWAPGKLAGSVLVGWGCFNLAEGVIDHLALGIHHVNELVDVSERWAWDGGFLLWGALMFLLGLALLRAGRAGPGAAA
jgi:uncharacterized membrane protein